MTVIAITHEIGTLGSGLATTIAEHFGLIYAGKGALENRVAERLTETRAMYGSADDAAVGFDGLLEVTDSTLARHAAAEIGELAAYGNIVLRGWGATRVLRDAPHVLRVRFVAALDFRLDVLASAFGGRSYSDLRRMIVESDRMLSSNLEPVFGDGWRSETSYDLVLPSDQLSLRQITDRVERAVHDKAHAPSTHTIRPFATHS